MSIWKIALGFILGVILLGFLRYIVAGIVFAAAMFVALIVAIVTPGSRGEHAT